MVQAALDCLVGVCKLAGAQFMVRRVQIEVWPVLLQLMKQGIPEHKHQPYPAGELYTYTCSLITHRSACKWCIE